MTEATPSTSFFEKSILGERKVTWEIVLFVLILILAVVSRFYNLGERVMSHDETSHVYFSWLLEQGRGYKHDPITHGPLQFHLVSLSYFLFGDNDFTSRIPAALFSIATIAFMWNYRRLIGKAGTLIAALLLLISPYLLYYGRYARNEAFVVFFGVVTMWGILQYLENGQNRYLYWVTIATALHFTAKETSFIYTAQAIIFLALFLIQKVANCRWEKTKYKNIFILATIISLLLISLAATVYLINRVPEVVDATKTQSPYTPGQELSISQTELIGSLPLILIITGIIIASFGLYFLIRGYTWEALRNERAFSLFIILFTLVLPMLAPFPVRFLGWNPIDYNSIENRIVVTIFISVLTILSGLIGMLWHKRLWLINALIFYIIFIIFYTTLFTNGFGLVTGLVGSLGYWLEQQGVNRGSQPWYYYWLIQLPIYEYLPLLGSLLALIIAFRQKITRIIKAEFEEISEHILITNNPRYRNDTPATLFGYWAFTSLAAYTIAGEKMPWLTCHITLPLILLSAWALGKLVEMVDWQSFQKLRGFLLLLLVMISVYSTIAGIGTVLGSNPPFQGKELVQLQATSTFLTTFLVALVSNVCAIRVLKSWNAAQFGRIVLLLLFSILAILTVRTTIMASFINYDNATEYLIYAHSARGPKDALEQIEEISRRTEGGLALRVAYDNETTYPYWWYLRNYTNQNYYGENPTRDLRDAPVILVGDNNYGKIEPIVGKAFFQFDYIRLWWPNQEYFNLTWDRIFSAIKDSRMRLALFQIWFNRDYRLFGELTNKDMSLENWYPSARMRLYIRKDIVSKLWNYGSTLAEEEAISDPYEGKGIQLTSDKIIGTPGNQPGQLQRPRDLAVASDGSIYVVDTDNNRIQHLSREGDVIDIWGSFGDVTTGIAPGGTFNQPWGIGLAPDGSVYVADTWNHRIQKFNHDGGFIMMWGYFGQAETPDALWGPRDVLVDETGMVYVTDTGNKRIVVFNSNGQYVTQVGTVGMALGQFDEPVGIALGSGGKLFIVDTWNQRVQVLLLSDGNNILPITSWDIVGWYGQSLDNKPFIAVDTNGNVFVTDPEGYRILQFNEDGNFIKYWGDYSIGPEGFGMPSSIAIDPNGGIWVSDAGNSRLMHFIDQ